MADMSIRNATKRVNLTKRTIMQLQGHAQGHTYTGGLSLSLSLSAVTHAPPLSCVSSEAYKLAQCTKPQGWGS